MYVYLSYEGDGTNWVYFDDLKITHTKNNVVQYNEYYPFGLQTSSSWTRENSNNDFLYNEGSELNKTTGWYETPFRNYDAALGRLTSVDPMATKYASFSSYHYAYNNPVMSNDPSGADPQSDVQTQFSYMLAMEKLRQELADMARKALLEQYPFYDGPLDPTAAAVYYGMQQEAERQREASLLARARRGDMQAIREYASTHGGLVRYEGAEAQALFSALYSMEEAKLGRRAPAGPPTPSGGQAQQGGAGPSSNPSTNLFELYLRMLVHMPNAVSFGGNVEAIPLTGGGVYERGKIYMLDGKGGQSKYQDVGIGLAGIDGGANVVFTEYYYVNLSGKPYDFTISDHAGPRLSAGLDGNIFGVLSVGVGFSIAPVNGLDSKMFILSRTFF